MDRIFLLTIVNLAICKWAALEFFPPDSLLQKSIYVALIPFVVLPAGWLLALLRIPLVGVVLINAPCWAICVDWLLRRLIDTPHDPDSGAVE